MEKGQEASKGFDGPNIKHYPDKVQHKGAYIEPGSQFASSNSSSKSFIGAEREQQLYRIDLFLYILAILELKWSKRTKITNLAHFGIIPLEIKI